MAKRDNKYPARSRDKEERQNTPGRGGKNRNEGWRKEGGPRRDGDSGQPENSGRKDSRPQDKRQGQRSGSPAHQGKPQFHGKSQPYGKTQPHGKPHDRPYEDSQAELQWDGSGEESRNLVIGRNPVTEALKSGRQIDRICIQKDIEGSGKVIMALAREKKLVIQYVDKQALDRIAASGAHQGVAAYVSPYEYCEVEDILAAAKSKGEDPLVILLDGLEDPHNLGAIMRTAEASGAHGIIIPARRSVSLTETVAKASAGAIEYMPVAKVANIVQAMEQLKKEGLWIAACDMGGKPHYEADVTGPLGLVIGGEGQGVSRLVREKCDFVVSIPMKGKITSLNASNAAAVLLYEVYRQREKGK